MKNPFHQLETPAIQQPVSVTLDDPICVHRNVFNGLIRARIWLMGIGYMDEPVTSLNQGGIMESSAALTL